MSYYYQKRKQEIKREQKIYEHILKRRIDIPKLISQYESGMGEERIKILHRLDDVELKCILKRHITPEIELTRNSQKSALDKYKFNIMGIPKYEQDNEKPLTIQEAISLVEGNDER